MGLCTLLACTLRDSDYTITTKRSLCQDGSSNRRPGRCPSKTLYAPSIHYYQPTLVSPLSSLIDRRLSPPRTDHALAQLFDSAEPVHFQTVRQVIHSELGEWPEGLFIEFDEKPLGSAVRLPLSLSPFVTILLCTYS